MFRKQWRVALASLLALVTAAQWPGAYARHAAAADVVTLKFAVETTAATALNAMTKALIEPFEKAYPNIKVQLVPYNGAATLDQQLKVTLAAGAGPDVYDENAPTYMPPLIDAGGAANLDPYAKQTDMGLRPTTADENGGRARRGML